MKVTRLYMRVPRISLFVHSKIAYTTKYIEYPQDSSEVAKTI